MTGPDPTQVPDFTHPGEVPDFTVPRKAKVFRCGGELFTAPPLLAPATMRRLTHVHADFMKARAEVGDADAVIDMLSGMFRMLLPGEQGERFAARLAVDPENDPETVPIDPMREAIPAMYWLMESYGLRPTEASSPSSNGSTDASTATPNDGIFSTAGASSMASAPVS